MLFIQIYYELPCHIKINQLENRGTCYLNLKVLHKHFCLQGMEGVEITMTLEIIADNSPAMGP